MKTVIVISGAWPGVSKGYELANKSSFLIYSDVASDIHYFGPNDESAFHRFCQEHGELRCYPMDFVRKSRHRRFLISLFSLFPAITVRFWRSRSNLLLTVSKITKDKTDLLFVYEDIPVAYYLGYLKRNYPSAKHVVRSHNVVTKGFLGQASKGRWYEKLAWKIELGKIERFEKQVAYESDVFLAITENDCRDYENIGVVCDGVFGVHLDFDKYQEIPLGDPNTIVFLGTADLRKGGALKSFIFSVWPQLKREFPYLKLVLAGKGTRIFNDKDSDVLGLGFVDDEEVFLSKGAIFINPQQDGSGIKIKSLVAMAAGKVLVTTQVGIEGIAGEPEKDYIVVKDIYDFYDKISDLIQGKKSIIDISSSGRASVIKNYSYENLKQSSAWLVDNVF